MKHQALDRDLLRATSTLPQFGVCLRVWVRVSVSRMCYVCLCYLSCVLQPWWDDASLASSACSTSPFSVKSCQRLTVERSQAGSFCSSFTSFLGLWSLLCNLPLSLHTSNGPQPDGPLDYLLQQQQEAAHHLESCDLNTWLVLCCILLLWILGGLPNSNSHSVSLATIYAVPLEQIHPFHRGLIVADYSKTSDSWEKGRWSRLCQEIDDQLLIVCGVSSIFEESMEPTTYIWKSVVAPNFAQGSAIFKLFIIYRLKNGFVQLQPEWNCRAHQREKTFIRSSQE